MASRITQIVATWADAAGKQAVQKFNVPVSVISGSIQTSDVITKVQAILNATEKITKLKFIKCQMVLPLNPSTSGMKEDAVAGSTIFRTGFVNFLTSVGDSQKRTQSRHWIISPKSSELNSNQTAFDTSKTSFTDFVSAVKDNLTSTDGRTLEVVGDTGVKQRRGRK